MQRCPEFGSMRGRRALAMQSPQTTRFAGTCYGAAHKLYHIACLHIIIEYSKSESFWRVLGLCTHPSVNFLAHKFKTAASRRLFLNLTIFCGQSSSHQIVPRKTPNFPEISFGLVHSLECFAKWCPVPDDSVDARRDAKAVKNWGDGLNNTKGWTIRLAKRLRGLDW